MTERDVYRAADLMCIRPEQSTISENGEYITYTVLTRNMNRAASRQRLAEWGYRATFGKTYIIVSKAAWAK